MIHYDLRCDNDHAFDGWFKDSASFDHQAQVGLVSCPMCNSVVIARALMAPALGRGSRHAVGTPAGTEVSSTPDSTGGEKAQSLTQASPGGQGGDIPDQLRGMLQRLRTEVEKHCDYVGSEFAEEARRIHYGDSKARGIYGEATPAEAESLTDEGIDFGTMPWLRRSES